MWTAAVSTVEHVATCCVFGVFSSLRDDLRSWQPSLPAPTYLRCWALVADPHAFCARLLLIRVAVSQTVDRPTLPTVGILTTCSRSAHLLSTVARPDDSSPPGSVPEVPPARRGGRAGALMSDG